MLHGRPIKVFNNGDMLRDFTYIDDIIEGILRVIDHIPTSNQDWSAQTLIRALPLLHIKYII